MSDTHWKQVVQGNSGALCTHWVYVMDGLEASLEGFRNFLMASISGLNVCFDGG